MKREGSETKEVLLQRNGVDGIDIRGVRKVDRVVARGEDPSVQGGKLFRAGNGSDGAVKETRQYSFVDALAIYKLFQKNEETDLILHKTSLYPSSSSRRRPACSRRSQTGKHSLRQRHDCHSCPARSRKASHARGRQW